MTPNDVHDIADEMGIPWDNDPEFMKWCNDLTGKSHLDDMNQEQLTLIGKALKNGDKPGRRIAGFWRFTDPDSKFRQEEIPYVSLRSF
jgi:hypothetical protein